MWALVTGGAARLGAQVCRALAHAGKNVAIHYRTSKSQALQLKEELQELGTRAEIIQGDFSHIQSVREFLSEYTQRFSKTEILVNNVGNYLVASPSAIEPEKLHDLIQVNTISPLMIIQGLLDSLKNCHGHIVNIGMIGSHTHLANTHATAYHMSKLALAMLTKSLAKELAIHSVSVNMVSPGYLEESLELPTNLKSIPAGRLATFQEVAEAVLFFTKNSYITGQILEVGGGFKL